MKCLIHFILVGWMAAMSPAQTVVTTPVTGFLTLHLQEGSNFLGFALLPAQEVQGTVNIAPDRTHVLLQGSLTLANDQFNTGAHPSHALEIVSAGAGQGFVSVVTDTLATGNELTLQEAVPNGVDNGAVVKIWRLWTLADAFGATNTAGLTGGTAPETADLVLLPNGADFDRYFYSTGGAQGTGWRKVGGGSADQAAVSVPLTGGAAIVARSAKSILVTGQVKSGSTQVRLQTGHNYLANLCPVNATGSSPSAEGRTLGNSGLQTGLAGAPASGLADLVLLWNGQGYDQYFYATGGLYGTGWRRIGTGAADQAGVALPDGAYVILRRGAAVTILVQQGNF